MRFRRFLAVAWRQCFLETASPSRAVAVWFSRQSTVNHRSRLRTGFSKTRVKAAGLGRRFSLRKRYRVLPGVCSLSASAMTSALAVSAGLRCQLGAALGPPPLEHESAGLRRHASPKTVRAGTLDLARLVSAFHRLVPGRAGPPGAGVERGGKGTQMPFLCQ